MTRLISAADCQALGIGLALSDAALEAAIDREEAELIHRFGTAAASRTETVDGEYEHILVRRQISAVSAVTEADSLGDTPTTLAATDYHTRVLTGALTRLPEGQFWGREVAVTYTPVDDTSLRKEVLIELVRIATEEASGAGSGSVSGLGFSVAAGRQLVEYATQRGAQYARLERMV